VADGLSADSFGEDGVLELLVLAGTGRKRIGGPSRSVRVRYPHRELGHDMDGQRTVGLLNCYPESLGSSVKKAFVVLDTWLIACEIISHLFLKNS
jgi:hypothetical protein